MRNRIRSYVNDPLPACVLERLAGDCRAERPGPDGIRHRLVARIKAEIAAGTYDTEAKWLAAEARLLNRVCA
jgi:Anti-sigma-28 factor, FlgM